MTEPGREPRHLLDLSDEVIVHAVKMSQRFGLTRSTRAAAAATRR